MKPTQGHIKISHRQEGIIKINLFHFVGENVKMNKISQKIFKKDVDKYWKNMSTESAILKYTISSIV